MRIAILVGGLPPEHNGGTEIAAVKIAKCAAGMGHTVHLIAASRRSKHCYADGVLFHEVATVPTRLLRGAIAVPESFSLLLRLKLELVHVQAPYAATPALLLNLAKRTPYLLYERGGIYRPFVLNGILYRTTLGRATRIVAQTGDQAEALRKYTDKDIEVIPNGVNAADFGILTQEKAREELGLPLGGRVIVSVGRCRPEKSIGCFVEAARMDTNYNNTYVVVGDGPEMGELVKAAHGRVRFEGKVDNSSVAAYLSAADIFVNTSQTEGFPVAVLEAMASGLPIIAPRICGLPEIISDGENGILTRPGSSLGTHEAIVQLLRNRDQARAMGEKNRTKARLYSWERVVEKLYGAP